MRHGLRPRIARAFARVLALGLALAAGAAHSTPTAVPSSAPTHATGRTGQARLHLEPRGRADDWPLLPAARACFLPGLSDEARCSRLMRPLDPAQPNGPSIALAVVRLPATGPAPEPDPVTLIAGGPGQSAIDLAGALASRHQKLQRTRDLVFVDQRGTGRSAPLACADDDALMASARPLAEQWSSSGRLARLQACREALQRTPSGRLDRYGTILAADDLDAVRAALGATRWNVIGHSYGTRVGLELLRRHPERVRRLVLDGVVPPDMGLVASMAVDPVAAWEAVVRGCAADAACRRLTPNLDAALESVVARLPWATTLPTPSAARRAPVTIDETGLSALLRTSLYVPSVAAGLPAAVQQAADGDASALAALAESAFGGEGFATGMHFAVVCSEDVRDDPDAARAATASAGASNAAARLALATQRFYAQACAGWPRGAAPLPLVRPTAASAPVLLLSGGSDPATPPRHAERIRAVLGERARSLVVAQAGHGLLAIGCVRDRVHAFIGATDDAAAPDAGADRWSACAALPRPKPFIPPRALPAATPASAP